MSCCDNALCVQNVCAADCANYDDCISRCCFKLNSGELAVELADVVVDSQIVSNFDGWDGETIFDLANGQVWQQSGPGVAVHVAVRPRAFVYRKAGSFRMQVQGVNTNVPVTRLR